MRMRSRSGFLVALPFLLPSLIGMVLFSLLPIVVSALISITDWTGMSPVSLTHGFFGFVQSHFNGVKNFSQILRDQEMWKALSHNAYFIIVYLPLMLLISLKAATIINSPRNGANSYRVLYYIPVLTSWVAGALIWKWLLSPTYGPINNGLSLFGITGPLWLQSELWAMPSIVLASLWKDIGFYSMIFLGGLRSINPQYYEAAEIDGASSWTSFWHITIPLLSPVTFYVVMLSLINAFQLFPQVMVMTKDGEGGPNGATIVMVERIYKYAFRYGKMGYAAAYSWVLFAVIMCFTILQKSMEKKWVNYDM
ncbi:permease component of ABC-type sugar transporter [Sphaerochaeta pleomorpha str. Grapes]|uniref:Permease component of ABC-type sugar transporter n=1 Tax=Sphaerochaeta pleomorpha (strain ATCC BAA-1885 / DSM 22778 / Grapes) TaxID=158190 RepID=G8QRE5_SPHPG|nr:sugar ABC transporter permease [Sphaerochaeta pleomorpha]AEV28798.1 permease component of ABC-type sugar transporter [Sphaerochaeta pleomorpha str. Grapes]